MRDMTPGIEANGEIERGGRKLEGVDVPMAKLRQMAEPVFARPRLRLCVADHRDVHAQHSTAEVPRQVARRAPRAASDVEHGRSGHDAGPPLSPPSGPLAAYVAMGTPRLPKSTGLAEAPPRSPFSKK